MTLDSGECNRKKIQIITMCMCDYVWSNRGLINYCWKKSENWKILFGGEDYNILFFKSLEACGMQIICHYHASQSFFDTSESRCDCKLTQLQSDATGMHLPLHTPQHTAVTGHSSLFRALNLTCLNCSVLFTNIWIVLKSTKLPNKSTF